MDTKKYAQLSQLHYLIDKYPDQERAEKKKMRSKSNGD